MFLLNRAKIHKKNVCSNLKIEVSDKKKAFKRRLKDRLNCLYKCFSNVRVQRFNNIISRVVSLIFQTAITGG